MLRCLNKDPPKIREDESPLEKHRTAWGCVGGGAVSPLHETARRARRPVREAAAHAVGPLAVSPSLGRQRRPEGVDEVTRRPISPEFRQMRSGTTGLVNHVPRRGPKPSRASRSRAQHQVVRIDQLTQRCRPNGTLNHHSDRGFLCTSPSSPRRSPTLASSPRWGDAATLRRRGLEVVRYLEGFHSPSAAVTPPWAASAPSETTRGRTRENRDVAFLREASMIFSS